MCGDLERVQDAQAIGLHAQTAVCKRTIKNDDGTKATVTCPLFDRCSYQAQTGRRADLWIMAHEMLFYEKPTAMGKVAAVVVDEAAWRAGLIGAEGGHLTLSLDALAEDVRSGPLAGMRSRFLDRLADLRRQLLDVLRPMSDGPIRRAALQGTLLVADSAAEALKLEYARKLDLLHPGQSRKERKDAMERADGNRTIARLAMVWNAIRELLAPGGPEASGWLALGIEKTKDGPVRVLHIKNRKQITDGFKAPTLLLDAMLPVELVRPFWPDMELVADVRAEAPHQHVRQGLERAYALSMLEPLADEAAEKDPEEARRRRRNLRDLRALLVREARRYAPGKVLVVLQQGVETAILDSGTLPPNVETAHHNNIAGRDQWRDVHALIVVGRTMPPPSGVERIAEALTGRAIPTPMEWYERADATREMADGSTVAAEADRHTDPIAESARWQIAEGELLQIIGRARGVNRTADNPVDVLVLTDVPLPIPLAGVLETADLEVTPDDQMLAAGGIVFENPRHASAAYPFLWKTWNAAKIAFKRAKEGSNPYRSISIGERPLLRRVAYQLAGQGKQAVAAKFDSALCPDPEAFLVERLGPLAWWRVEDVPPPEPPPAPEPGGPEPEPPGPELPPRGPPPGPDPPPASGPGTSRPVAPGIVLPNGRVVPPADMPTRPEKAPSTTCDVPWLHPEVPAFAAPDGRLVVLCPHCGEPHRHRGFGHRLAHCDEPAGRGYVLKDAGAFPHARGSGAPGFEATYGGFGDG